MRQTTRGLFWSFLDSFGVYAIKLGFSIVIARTLSPADYGLMGMIVIFISLGQVLMQSGFSLALIQRKESDSVDFSTAFWFNTFTALLIYLVLFFSAGGIARFFDRPLLVPITRVAAIGIVLNSLCSVQSAILTRQMNFRKLTWINLPSALVSGMTGLVMAMRGYEVWALVFQTLAGNVIYLAGLWFTSGWRPQFLFSLSSFSSLFRFGYKVLLQGLTDVIFTKSYFPIIGKLFPVAQLGYYTNANRFHEIFIRQTTISVSRVIFPAFSKIQDQRERYALNYLKSFTLLSMVMFMGSLILIIAARPFVSLALTSKWLPAVPYMHLFFLEGFFYPLMMFNLNILYSADRGGMALLIDSGRKVLMGLGILLLYRAGIRALIAGQVASTFAGLLFTLLAVVKDQEIDLGKVVLGLVKMGLIAGACFAFSYFLVDRFVGSDLAQLAIKLTLVPLLFLLLVRAAGMSALTELKNVVSSLPGRKGQAAEAAAPDNDSTS